MRKRAWCGVVGGSGARRGAGVGANPHRHAAALRDGYTGVDIPTVFTVGLLQGGTPHARGAGGIGFAWSDLQKRTAIGHRVFVRRASPIASADTNNAHLPMHPANAGFFLALSHG